MASVIFYKLIDYPGMRFSNYLAKELLIKKLQIKNINRETFKTIFYMGKYYILGGKFNDKFCKSVLELNLKSGLC